MLAATSECSISDFIKKELKINNLSQEKDLVSGIVKILNEQRQWQLSRETQLFVRWGSLFTKPQTL
jgi:hypothetical protein